MGDLLQPWHMIAISIIFLFPAFIIGVIPFWFICKKAGFSPMLTFLNIIPFGLGTLLLVYLLAFAKWKVAPIAPLEWQPPMPQSPYPPRT